MPLFGRDDQEQDAPAPADEETVRVMVEIPKGSRNKYEYDPETGDIVFDRMLFSAVHYPTDYGFIPGTLAADGDALDALVMVYEPTFPGCVIEARPVGLFDMEDEKGRDEKLLCVPISDPQWNHIESLDDVPPHLLREVEHFFQIYKDLEGKPVKVYGWEDAQVAHRTIREAFERYEPPG